MSVEVEADMLRGKNKTKMLETLRRRLDWLRGRIQAQVRPASYDQAEAEALLWAIEVCERYADEHASPRTNPWLDLGGEG